MGKERVFLESAVSFWNKYNSDSCLLKETIVRLVDELTEALSLATLKRYSSSALSRLLWVEILCYCSFVLLHWCIFTVLVTWIYSEGSCWSEVELLFWYFLVWKKSLLTANVSYLRYLRTTQLCARHLSEIRQLDLSHSHNYLCENSCTEGAFILSHLYLQSYCDFSKLRITHEEKHHHHHDQPCLLKMTSLN